MECVGKPWREIDVILLSGLLKCALSVALDEQNFTALVSGVYFGSGGLPK